MRRTENLNLFHRFHGFAAVVLALAGSAGCLQAQHSLFGDLGSGVPVQGVVESAQPLGAGIVVELRGDGGFGAAHTDVAANGSFSFMEVPSGSYRLFVRDMYGNVLDQQFITVDRNMMPLSIHLRQPRVERPVSGTISVARLRHKVPDKARKEFEKAAKSMEKNDAAGAIKHLQKAIQIDPEYLEAHNNLGARYLMARDLDKALEQFQKAIALDPDAATPQSNAATALLALGRYGEAEQAARRAVDLNPLNQRARFALGLSLMEQNKFTAEAVESLKRVSAQFPKAHLGAARILAAQGRAAEARAHIEQYLTTGNPDDRDMAREWLQKLDSVLQARNQR